MKQSDLFIIRPLLTVLLILFLMNPVFGQENGPINSNLLIENGISPRVLDAAASSLLQDGSFVQNMNILTEENGKQSSYDLQVIYDPNFKNGMDIRIVVDRENLTKEDKKYLLKLIENNHSFSRMSRNYLYDESTLTVIKNDGDEIVLEYYYQRNDIEPYLKEIKRLKGTIYIKKGELDKVVLTNIKPMKSKITSYERIVKFESVVDRGGHVVTSEVENIIETRKRGVIKYTITSNNIKITDDNNQNITWENQKTMGPFFENKETDTISVKLGWVLPLLGKPVTKLGYKLPRPIGLDVFMHYQEQTMQFSGLSAAMNDEDFISFNEFFDIPSSTISATSSVTAIKADVWLLPFLNIMAIVGNGKNEVYGNLPLNEEVRQGLADYGWLLDIDPKDVPESIVLRGSLESVLYGAGATLAGGVGNWNVSLSYQFMLNEITEANTTNVAHVFMPMLGYMTPFGMNLMLGAQGQFYDTVVEGFLELDDGQKLRYNVDFEPITWNTVFGIYKGFAKHWEIALQAGFGKRESVTAVFGYRF